MSTNERLMHRYVPFLHEGFMCEKCGDFCIDMDEVKRASMAPCVDDDDPCVASVQELINAKISKAWGAIRGETEMPQNPWNEAEKKKKFREEFDKWLDTSDPVMEISWEEGE